MTIKQESISHSSGRLEWAGATILVLVGAFLLKSASFLTELRLRDKPKAQSAVIGSIRLKKGTLRYRPAGSVAWRELSGTKKTVSEQETIYTGPESIAELKIGTSESSGVRAELKPQSLIVVSSKNSEKQDLGWRNLLIPIRRSPEVPVIEVKSGQLSLSMLSEAPSVELKALNKELMVRSSGQGSSLSISASPDRGEVGLSNESGQKLAAVETIDDKTGLISPVSIPDSGRLRIAAPTLASQTRDALTLASLQPQLDSRASLVPKRTPAVWAVWETETHRKSEFDPQDLHSIPVILQWKAIPDAQYYQVDAFQGNRQLLHHEVIQNTQVALRIESVEQKRVDYQISALLKGGEEIHSPNLSFQVELLPPKPSEPAADAALSGENGIVLTWQKAQLAEEYAVEVSAEERFEFPLVRQTSKSNYLLFLPEKPGLYYWRLKSLSGSAQSTWGPTIRFTYSKP